MLEKFFEIPGCVKCAGKADFLGRRGTKCGIVLKFVEGGTCPPDTRAGSVVINAMWPRRHCFKARRGLMRATQLQAQLSWLTDRTGLRIARLEDLRNTCILQVAVSPGRMCGECPGTARLCGQCTKTARQSELRKRRWMSSTWNTLGLATRTWTNL